MDNLFPQDNKTTGNSTKVLIPVDFSPKGSLALKVGFELARRLEREIVLLHASIIADPLIVPQFPDDFNGMDNENAEIEEMELTQEINRIDEHSMDELKEKLLKLQLTGGLPDIKFETYVAPGMPEEVISEYCTVTPPAVIVMATRGCQKRKEDLIGSVTAEIIDLSLAPVFTVPEDYTFSGFKEIVRICAFCFFDGADLDAIGKLMDMFDKPAVRIYLFPATDKYSGDTLVSKLEELKKSLKSIYPNSDFLVSENIKAKNLRDEAETLFKNESIQMILAPNRKRNAIARFFHPGLAHKILFEIDFPMLAIPV